MAFSNLTNYFKQAHPNNFYGKREVDIIGITPHHCAGNISLENLGKSFARADRGACSNYGISSDGRIGGFLDEDYASGCSNSEFNDKRMITIEIANDGREPDWHMSDAAIESFINLAADIYKRHNLGRFTYTGDRTGNVTTHRMFVATTCPGAYFLSKLPYIEKEVNRRLSYQAPRNVPQPIVKDEKIDIYYNVYTQKDKWLTTVVNFNNTDHNGYAGVLKRPIQGFASNALKGSVKYRVHLLGGAWLDWVTDCDYSKAEGYAGIFGKNIDGLQMTFLNVPDKRVRYRVHLLNGVWLDWVTDFNDTKDGYAGWYGKTIDAVQCEII